ncbi:hypothetical protein PIPA1_42650 [Pelosinus sp. IPA-1]|nr:hypothetical protein PIPA1_42650 [Pelosinus sp. IPA-1]
MFDTVFLEEFSIKRGINNIINMWTNLLLQHIYIEFQFSKIKIHELARGEVFHENKTC